MKRSVQHTLYHLLPILFWMLAVGGSLVPFAFDIPGYAWDYIPVALVLTCIWIFVRLDRYANGVEACFQSSLLIGIASCWLPSVVVLVVVMWVFLIYRRIFSLQVILAALMGLAVVGIWLFVIDQLSIFHLPFTLTKNAHGWIPMGCFLGAWAGSTIVRQTLRVR